MYAKANIQGILAVTIIGVGFIGLYFFDLKETISVSVVNLMIMVVGYYFGSSRSSKLKDERINQLENGA